MERKTKWILWSLVAVIVTSTVACSKKSSDNNPPPIYSPVNPYGGNLGCANCNFAQAPIMNAQSQGTASFNIAINWQILGDPNMMAQTQMAYGGGYTTGYPYGGTTGQTLYTGPISTMGTMVLAQNINATYCLLPQGQYTLSSPQAGQMSQGRLQFPQLVAVSQTTGVTVLFTFQNGVVVDSNGDGQVDRIYGLLVPVQINNQPCNDIGVEVY